MKMFKKAAILFGAAGAATALMAGPAFAGPIYATQGGSSSSGHCDNHVSGGNISSSPRPFVATAFGGVGCDKWSAAVEVVYYDNFNNEQADHAGSTPTQNGPQSQIIKQTYEYNSIVEVIGSQRDSNNNPTPGVYLYF
ncbi:hypothetical protein ACQ4WX_20605 [Streptomyces lasalocidi]|uniref:hypothetical protein n=1 Tax=Streptomyces sp. MUSC 14 TaxID=1354889 RepID=UPI00116070D1|nr:hypothetical protein [Streptomyces sp. MUSC 14]